jgi:hypothetical protein
MFEITVHPTAASVAAVQRSMAVLEREMGLTVRESVQWGATAVGRSLSAATGIAPKHRAVERRRIEIARTSKKTGKALKPRMVNAWGVLYDVPRPGFPSGTWRSIPAKMRGKRAAQNSLMGTIRNRGLAKMSWWWAHKKAGGSGMAQTGTRFAIAQAMRFGDSTASLTGSSPYVILRNKLDYALQALKGGPAAVGVAFQKASRGMLHRMRETLKRNGAKT